MAVRPPPPDDGRVRTVFLGSGAFAVPALQRLAANPLSRIVAVVTAPPRQAGRSQAWTPTPIAAAATGLGIHPVLTPPRLRHPDAIDAILALRPDLAVLADYGQIVPPPLLDRVPPTPAHCLPGWGCRLSGPNSSRQITTTGSPGPGWALPSAMS